MGVVSHFRYILDLFLRWSISYILLWPNAAYSLFLSSVIKFVFLLSSELLLFTIVLEGSTSQPFDTWRLLQAKSSACLRKSWDKSGTDALRMASLSLAQVWAWELCSLSSSSNGAHGLLRLAQGWALAWHMPTVRLT